MLLTLTQASAMYGKARSTWHRAIKSGRLSCSIALDGTRRIDLSELIRVYGEPPNSQHLTQQPVAPHYTPNATRNDAPDTYRELIEELRALRHEVSELRQQMLRLPAPDKAPVEAHSSDAEAPPSPTPADDDPHGLRALASKLRR